MKNLLLAFVFYGILYYVFEALFNWVSMVLLNKEFTWKEKLRLKTVEAPSFWMIPVGSLCGFLIHLYLLIPINYTNIFALIGLGLVSCVIITGLELASGLLLNVKLGLDLWDYDTGINIFGKTILLNFKKQIDVYHSVGWFFIAYLFLIVDKVLL
jgi:uncharacterized membrane protein